MGPPLCVRQGDNGVLYTHRRLSTRSLKTVFGTIEMVRMGYSRAGANSLYPLDAALALPARVFSYELQRRLVQAAVQGTFQESMDGIADLTGWSVSKRSLEELLVDAARDFDVFYQERVPAPADGSILVAADGKSTFAFGWSTRLTASRCRAGGPTGRTVTGWRSCCSTGCCEAALFRCSGSATCAT